MGRLDLSDLRQRRTASRLASLIQLVFTVCQLTPERLTERSIKASVQPETDSRIKGIIFSVRGNNFF
jgi:hypothetical protein